MVNYKNIRIKMKGGKSRMQRVKVLASGKYKFVKNLVKGKSRPKVKAKTKSTKRRKSNPKKGGSRRMGKNTMQTIYKVARVAAGIGPFLEPALHKEWPTNVKIGVAGARLTGYRFDKGEWDVKALVEGYGPLVATIAAQKAASFVRGLLRKL